MLLSKIGLNMGRCHSKSEVRINQPGCFTQHYFQAAKNIPKLAGELRRLETVREQLFVTALCFKKQVTRFGFRKEPLRQHMLSLQFIGCVSLTVSSCHLSIQAIRPSLPFRGKKGSPIAYAAMRSMDRRATSSVGMECIPSAVAAWEHRFAEFATENEKRTDVEGCRMLKACLSWWL